MADFSERRGARSITKLTGFGKLPYDGNVTPDGRHYLAGLFGEDGVVHVDLWRQPLAARRILDSYGRGEEKLPVYKMPHLEGWASAGDRLLLPAVGRHELHRRRPAQLRGGRPRRHSRAAGIRGRAPRRPLRLGQFRPSAQRHDRRGRQPDAAGGAPLQAPGRRCCTWSSRRAATRSGCRCAMPTACRSTTPTTFARKAEIEAREAVGHLLHRAGDEDRAMMPSAGEIALVDRWQRGFPLTARPFAQIGDARRSRRDRRASRRFRRAARRRRACRASARWCGRTRSAPARWPRCACRPRGSRRWRRWSARSRW